MFSDKVVVVTGGAQGIGGTPLWPRVADIPLEFWGRLIHTNLYGGGITNPPGAMAYAVTKDAIRTFTCYLAEDVREMSIWAVTFAPRPPIRQQGRSKGSAPNI